MCTLLVKGCQPPAEGGVTVAALVYLRTILAVKITRYHTLRCVGGCVFGRLMHTEAILASSLGASERPPRVLLELMKPLVCVLADRRDQLFPMRLSHFQLPPFSLTAAYGAARGSFCAAQTTKIYIDIYPESGDKRNKTDLFLFLMALWPLTVFCVWRLKN